MGKKEYTSRNGDTIVKLDCDTSWCNKSVRVINPNPFMEDNPMEGWTSTQIKRENKDGEEEIEILEVLCPRCTKEQYED
jgi:hypothetical protein